jgi:hypothetical protein
MPKFRISGAIPPLPVYAFMMCTGKKFILYLLKQYVQTYCAYAFQLLFDIHAVVLAMVLRPVILRILWNFEWL